MAKVKRRYNWIPDLPDQRDFLFREKVVAPLKLPTVVDLRKNCSPVFNQGQIGSCTGNALAGALEFLELKELKDRVDDANQPEIFTPKKFETFSRLFIYYNERVLEGTTDQDAGGALRDGVKALNQWGVCRESIWKYSSAHTLKKPSLAAYKEAKNHCISAYLKVENLMGVKNALALGSPVAFGFSVYESFESPQVAKTGVMPIPAPDESLVGGHAVLAVGYNDSQNMLIVRNSWGAEWGDGGYFHMPYAIVDQLKLARDFWVIQK